jgi:putative addiction module component (TIGR02574 family)
VQFPISSAPGLAPALIYFAAVSARVTPLAEEAKRLPAAERIRLVEGLLNSFDKCDPEIDAAWAEECERRLDAYLSGAVAARDADGVLAKHLKR